MFIFAKPEEIGLETHGLSLSRDTLAHDRTMIELALNALHWRGGRPPHPLMSLAPPDRLKARNFDRFEQVVKRRRLDQVKVEPRLDSPLSRVDIAPRGERHDAHFGCGG